MKKEQIIKALECCITGTVEECEKCPRHNIRTLTDAECMEGLNRDALALIKELTKENKKLKKENDDLVSEKVIYIQEKVTLKDENERLHGHLSQLKHRYDICKQNATNAKADTVREMQERFKELMGGEFASCGYCNAVGYWSVKAVKDNIDHIANEILNKTEEEKK